MPRRTLTSFPVARLVLGAALAMASGCTDDSDPNSDASSGASSGASSDDATSSGEGSSSASTSSGPTTGPATTGTTDASESSGPAPVCGDGAVDPATEECDPSAASYDVDCTDCEISSQGCNPLAPWRCTDEADGCIFDGQLFACQPNGEVLLNERCTSHQDCVEGHACLGAPERCVALCDREADSPFGECAQGTCMEVLGGIPGMPYIGVCDG